MSRWGWLLCVLLWFAVTPAAQGWRFDVGGRELELGGYLETRQVFRVDRATEHELNLQRLQFELRSGLSDRTSIEIVSSAQNGGPATGSTRSGFYDIDDVFQSVAPAIEIEEASLRYDGEAVSLRLGQIKHSWGKLDRYQPNDHLNPERFADPILLDEKDRKIGVPSIEASYFLPDRDWLPEDGGFTLVVVPRYVPFRMPLAGERWFPPNATPPATFTVRPPSGGTAFAVPLSMETRNPPPPAFSADNASVAARFAAHTRGLDYALYYYRGIQTTPLFRLDARADVATLAPGFSGTTILSPVFNPIQSWGADLAVTLGRFSVRAEAAFIKDDGFNRDLQTLVNDPSVSVAVARALLELQMGAASAAVDLGQTFAVSDSVQWGIGVDTQVQDFDLLFELSQTNVLDVRLPLLIDDNETVLLADLRRRFLRDDLTVQLVSLCGASSDYTVLLPSLTYRLYDRFEVRVGYAHIAGRAASRLGQYKDNDEGYIRLRAYL